MANTILIIGESGTGKSTSIRTLNPEETYIINVLDKPLPFKGAKNKYIQKENGNYYPTDNAVEIIRCAKHVSKSRPEIKNLIIDDYQYVMGNEFMRRSLEKGYDKFSQISRNGWEIILELNALRPDLDCFVLSHSHRDEDGFSIPKTIGKMFQEKIGIEGMVTVLLHSMYVDGEYKFLTNISKNHMAKTPMDMFSKDERLINNDLQFVKDRMNKYFNEDIPQ